MTGTLLVHPKRFAQALDNAAEFTEDKRGTEVNDSVWVSWTGETLRTMGRGRYAAGLHDLGVISGGDTVDYWSIIVHVEDAREVAKTVKGIKGSGSKDASVALRVIDDNEVGVFEGEHHLTSLIQLDDHEEYRATKDRKGIYEELERIAELPRFEEPPATPIVWTRGVLKKLLKVFVGDPQKDWDRFEAHWIGGATWAYRIVSPNHESAFVAMMESTRDNLE